VLTTKGFVNRVRRYMMSDKYVVMYQVDTGEYAYATAENPFTYDSKKLIFDTKFEAQVEAAKYNTGFVVEQADINPREAIRRTIMKGL